MVLTSIFRLSFPALSKQLSEISQSKVTILKNIDSLNVPKNNPIEHNATIINSLQQKIQNQQDGIIALERNESEARNFYTVILVGILSFLLNSINKKKLPNNIVILSLIFISIMYFVDIHFKDMEERSGYTKGIHITKIDSLVNLYPKR